jgi:hypothetical protein
MMAIPAQFDPHWFDTPTSLAHTNDGGEQSQMILEIDTDRGRLDRMRRRKFLSSSLGAAAMAFPQTQETSARLQRPPNILLLMYDKCRTDAIGAYEGIKDRTPNLNQLSASGVRFEHAYTPQALCAPARASVLTGLYPHAHGIRYKPVGSNNHATR